MEHAPWLWVLVAGVGGQLVKFVLYGFANRRLSLRVLVTTNGLPSVYAMTFGCLATMVGVSEGIRSPLFVIVFIFSGMVLHDSIRVRGSVDRGGRASLLLAHELSVSRGGPWLNQLLPLLADRRHRPLHVVVGLVLGGLCGLLWRSPDA